MSIRIVAFALMLVATAAAQPMPPERNAEIDQLAQELQTHERANDTAAQARVLRKLYAAQRKLSGDDAVWTWRRKVALASVLLQTGDTSEAISLHEELVASADRLHGPMSREAKDAIRSLIGAYQVGRRFDRVEAMYQRLLAITRQLDGDRSAQLATELGGYAGYLSTRSEYAGAQRAYEQAIQLADAAHADARGHLMMLGMLYLSTNQHPRAIAMFDRYLGLAKADPIVAQIQTSWWVAERYRYAGRLDLAKPLTKQAIELAEREVARIERDLGPAARELTAVLFSLGGMYRDSDDLAGADRVMTRLITLEEKLGGGFPPYAQLASLRRDQGRPREALALFEQATQAMAKLGGSRRGGNSGLYPMMADIHRELGELRQAEQLYTTAQADLDALFGKRAMLVLRLHLGLFGVHVAGKQLAKAERVLAENLDIAERELAMVLATGTEADHLAYFSREAIQLDTAISFHAHVAPASTSAARLALTTLLRRKGRVLDAAAAMLATVRARLPADDQKLLAQLDDARAKRAKLAVAGSQGKPDFAKDVAALEDQIRGLEVSLGKKSAQFRIASQPIELAAVQAQIPADARLVEIASYQPRDFTAAFRRNPPPTPRRYAAYVLASRGDPVLVELGPAAPIDDAIAKFRGALADPDNDRVAELAKVLHDLTFGKIAPRLGAAKQVLISPDGALDLIPFAALSDGKQYLIKRYAFTYLTSGRDLLRLGRGKASGGTIIFADPDFDTTGAAPPGGSRRSRAMSGLHWGRLPGTGQEADAIAKTLAGSTIYRDRLATETTLKAVHAPRVLHLATHGFFLDDAADATENPLLRSGLALAGANKLASGGDDGVVTALEASGLDLWGTQLVVLSACETGVGKVSNGEGVYGLRRALVIAGAETVVTTLWQVDDLATRDLMDGYYRRLEAHQGRGAALRDTQLELLATPKYAHPFYWASFLPAGDGAPLH